MRCLLTRWSISAEADGSARSPRTQKHLSGCSKCSAFATQVSQIGESLRLSGAQAPAAIDRSSHRLVFGSIFAGAAGLAVILLVLNVYPNSPRRPDAKRSSSAMHQVATTTDDNLLNRIAHHIVKKLSEADPRGSLAVHDEIYDVQTLAGDARGGLRYVLRVSGLQAVR